MKVVPKEVPNGWEASSAREDEVTVHRTFLDGTDVLLTLREQDGSYALTATAEARTSGPNTNTVGVFSSLDGAIQVLLRECEEWERHVNGDDWDLSQLRAL